MRRVAACAGIVTLCFVGFVPPAVADANADPTYEVKIDLTSAALTSSGTPTAAVLSAFGLGSSGAQRSYEYLDTSALDLDGQGWDVRIRHKSGKDLELSYKKRFAVNGSDEAAVDDALDTANAAGFDASDTNYDAEVDWGYSKQTLSFSNEKSASAKSYSGTSLPSGSTAVRLGVSNCPGKLQDWSGKNWGTDTLQSSRVHGPVTSTVWSGSYDGEDASLEVLPVRSSDGSGTERVVEFSVKVGDRATAADVRSDAIALADSRGWLLHGDVLKTQLVLTRY